MADVAAVQDFVQYWKPILKQKTVLACYRHGSDEIVGLNMNYVTFKDEHFVDRLLPQVFELLSYAAKRPIIHFLILFFFVFSLNPK